MPLPYLKPKNVAGLIMAQRKAGGGQAEQPLDSQEESQENYALELCAEEIIRSVESKDPKRLYKALQAAFQVMELEPHEEVEHEDESSPHTYEAQNEKAGRGEI